MSTYERGKHFVLTDDYSVQITKRRSRYEWAVYKGLDYRNVLAAGEANTPAKAKSEAARVLNESLAYLQRANRDPQRRAPRRDPNRRAPNDYVVINYHDTGSRIVRGPIRVYSANEAIEKAAETPHSSIEVHDPNGWVLLTLIFSPKHPINRGTLNKLLMRS